MEPSESKVKYGVVSSFAGLLPYGRADSLEVVVHFCDVREDGSCEDYWWGLTSQGAQDLAFELLKRSYELESFNMKQQKQEEVTDGTNGQ